MGHSNYACEDIGNLVLLEHINLTIPDQRLATAFYVSALGLVRERNGALQAVIAIGTHQQLVYAETLSASQEYDGHHIQIYASDFSGPYERLAGRGLIYGEETHQYRFAELVDPVSGTHCFTLEHEVRSLRHPLYARPLVNRNPDLTNRNYRMGGEEVGGMF